MNTNTPITPVSTPLKSSGNKQSVNNPGSSASVSASGASARPLTSSVGSQSSNYLNPNTPIQLASMSQSNLYSTPLMSRAVSVDSLNNLYVSDSAVESGSHEVLSNSPKSLKPLAGLRGNNEYLVVEDMARALNAELKDHTFKNQHLVEQALPQTALPKEFIPKLSGLCDYLSKNDAHRPEHLNKYFAGKARGKTKTAAQQPTVPQNQSGKASSGKKKAKAAKTDSDDDSDSDDSDKDEEAYKQWFNHIAESLDNLNGAAVKPCGRRFSAEFADKSPEGETPEKRKPDLVLIVGDNMDARSAGNWATLLAVYELTKSADFPPRISKEASQRALLLLKNCPGRRFVPIVCVSGRQYMYSVFHRSGLTRSMRYDIVDNLYEFYYILLCLLFCPPEYLGFDPSIKYNDLGVPSEITLNDDVYDILANLYVREGIQGRGTVCWSVRNKRTGKMYMLKIAWVDILRKHFEPEFFQQLKELEIIGVPILVWEGVSKINGVDDSTAIWQPSSSGALGSKKKFIVRKCHKLLLDGVGRPITSFKSKYELISAIIDIVKAHMRLTLIAKILHRDASLWNMFIIDKYPKYKRITLPSNVKSTPLKEVTGKTPQQPTSAVALGARGGSSTSTDTSKQASTKSNPSSDKEEPVYSSFALDAILNDESARLSLWNDILSGKDVDEEPDVFGQSRTVGRGMLSDFNYSSFIAEFQRALDDLAYKRYLESVKEELRTRTGTLPFMSIQVLLGAETGTDFYHKYKDDIESIIYGLMSICINYAGPNGVKRDFSKEGLPGIYGGSARSPFDTWKQHGMTWVELGIAKAGTWAHLDDWVFPCFHKYFNDMKDLFSDLEKALWPPPPTMTVKDYSRRVNSPVNYIDIIQILTYHRDLVSEPMPPPNPDPQNTKGPSGHNPTVQKNTGSGSGSGVRRSPRMHPTSLPGSSHSPKT